MTLLTAQAPVITGIAPSFSAVTSSDTIRHTNAPKILHVKNGGGGSINVTVVVPGTKYGQQNPDVVVAVPAGAERLIAGFTGEMAVDGIITVNYSGTTTVTAALYTV